MSFFRNLRSSITRGRSSSRDTTPVRSSRPGSAVSSLNSGSGHGKRRDSLDSRNDSLLNRSGTFILDESDVTPSHSNCSTLEKKSKKSKVLEKFSTFTKRKKTPAASLEASAFEHHPSDDATNTYYKWQAEGGGNSLDYDSQSDPFNFLYEQQSSLKSTQQNVHNPHTKDHSKSSLAPINQVFDSSTYRKGKMPSDLKKQLRELKDQEPILCSKENTEDTEHEEKDEEDCSKPYTEADKYKTVTLNSFRKSFREKFLQQQREANHNPAWFVEVDTAELNKNKRDERDTSKENRRDLLVFENDNYRPGTRSPIRDVSNRKPMRSPARSPVKRNDTFKVDRVSRIDNLNKPKTVGTNAASIRIEFKNSITPHMPGRMVPVGVAKPMPVQYYRETEPRMNTSYAIKTAGNTTTTRLNNNSPVRSAWNKIQSPAKASTAHVTPHASRYQTLVQIKNDKPAQKASPVVQRNSKLSTRVQLNNGPSDPNRRSPSFGKRYNNTHLLNGNSITSKAAQQTFKQTYFGESPQTIRTSHTSVVDLKTPLTSRTNNYTGHKYRTSTSASPFASATTLTSTKVLTSPLTTAVRSTPSYSAVNSNSSSHNNLSQMKYHNNHSNSQTQQRFIVPAQRRSRSPIKIPWR